MRQPAIEQETTAAMAKAMATAMGVYDGMVCLLCVHKKISSLWRKRYSSVRD